MTIISFHSYRGGTGKSTLIANVAALLALKGMRVGLVDLDLISPGLGVIFNVPTRCKACKINNLLLGGGNLIDAVIDVTPSPNEIKGFNPALNGLSSRGKLYLIPASFESEDIFRLIKSGYSAKDCVDIIQKFKEFLNLDLLFIDTHPGFEEDTLLALASTDLLTIVLRADLQDYMGVKIAVNIGRRLGKNVCLLLNMVPSRILEVSSFVEEVKKTFEVPVIGIIPFYEEVLASMGRGLFVVNNSSHSFTSFINKISNYFAYLASR